MLLVQQVFEDVRAGVADRAEGEMAELVLLSQRLVNAASAVQMVALAGIAARDEVQGPDGAWGGVDRGVGHVSEFASVTVAPMLGLTPRGAQDRVQTAAALVSRLPGTLAAMAAGHLDGWRASIIVAETAETTAAGCEQVEAVILPRVCGETGGQVRARTRRALTLVDSEAVRLRAAKARLERSVRVWPSHVIGLSEWVAVLPAHESALCKSAVDDHACVLRREDPDLSVDQARADALVDLILARVQVSTTVHLTMPVQAVAGGAAGAGPADGQGVPPEGMGASGRQAAAIGSEVPGVGVIPSEIVAGICASFDTRIKRVLLDEVSGTTVETGAKGYAPPAAVGRFVRHRDGHCRAPGCAREARFCDLDHVIPWPSGPTDPTNLLTLCRRHHRMKHQTRWSVVMDAGGTATWTDPFGQEFITHPVNHHDTLVA